MEAPSGVFHGIFDEGEAVAYANPTIVDFKDYFTRDFPYGTDPENNVLDADIGKGIQQAVAYPINPGLYSTQDQYTLGFLYMAAHFMVQDLRASSQGINGQFNFLQASKAAGAVNESFTIPQRVLDSPVWSMFTKTNYGMMMLQMIAPRLVGNIISVQGTTRI